MTVLDSVVVVVQDHGIRVLATIAFLTRTAAMLLLTRLRGLAEDFVLSTTHTVANIQDRVQDLVFAAASLIVQASVSILQRCHSMVICLIVIVAGCNPVGVIPGGGTCSGGFYAGCQCGYGNPIIN